MRGAEVREWLGRLEESSAPEPSAAFVAKLEADLRAMDQVGQAAVPQKRSTRRTRRARLLVVAAPVAALTAAAAAAAMTLLPSDPHPRRVTTADPGITVPARPADQPVQPAPTTSTPTTVAPPPWLPPVAAPPTTPTITTRRTTPAPGPGDHTVTTPAPPAGDRVSPTVPPVTTTTTPPVETLTLHCGGGMPSGSPAVSCAWSQSTAASFAWYRLWREVAGSPHVLVFSSDNRPTTSYGDQTVQAGTTYVYKVEVTDSAGNVIGRSNAATVPCC